MKPRFRAKDVTLDQGKMGKSKPRSKEKEQISTRNHRKGHIEQEIEVNKRSNQSRRMNRERFKKVSIRRFER